MSKPRRAWFGLAWLVLALIGLSVGAGFLEGVEAGQVVVCSDG